MSGIAIEPVLALRKVAPTQPTMTACEALFWIGLGVLKTSQELSDETTAFLERWTYLPAESLLKALEGRAATEPYCAIGIFTLDGEPEVRYAHPVLSPNGPRLLRRLRAKARRREQRDVSYRELAARLAEELSAEARNTAQLESAAAELLTEIRSERVTAWGQRDFEPGRPNRGAVHERIPVEIFMHPAMSVTILDQVRPDGNAPIEQWIHWKGPYFGGVQFKTAEILSIWPARENTDLVAKQLTADRASDELRRQYVARQFASPFWTVWNVISWMAYRDPADFCVIEGRRKLMACKMYENTAIAMKNNRPEATLRHALQSGILTAITNGAEMAREHWAGKDPWSYRDIHFRREDVLGIWPPLSDQVQSPEGSAGFPQNESISSDPPGPKPGGRIPLKALVPKIATDFLNERNIPKGRTRRQKLIGAIYEKLKSQGTPYKENSIGKALDADRTIARWERANPDQ